MKTKKRNFYITILFIFLMLLLSGCNQSKQTRLQTINLSELIEIKTGQIKSIIIKNMGDGSSIELSNRTDIEDVMDYLSLLQFTDSVDSKMTLTGYSVRFITGDSSQGKVSPIQLDGSFAEFQNVIYSVLDKNEKGPLNIFLEKQFEKKWGIANSSEVALNKLIGIDFNQVKKAIVSEYSKGIQIQTKSSEDIMYLRDFMNSVRVKQVGKTSATSNATNVQDNMETSFNVSFFLNELDTETVYNITFTDKQLSLGSSYWYDIVNSGYDINFFKYFSSNF